MIRNYVNYEKLNIKLIGSGRDKDYSKDGFSHWCEDDIKILSNSFPNIELYKPPELSKELFLEIINKNSPCYLNLKRSI
jgi:transketolase C-terminal domain/subunit